MSNPIEEIKITPMVCGLMMPQTGTDGLPTNLPREIDDPVQRRNWNNVHRHFIDLNNAIGNLIADAGKVKVDAGDGLDFLEDQVFPLNARGTLDGAEDFVVSFENADNAGDDVIVGYVDADAIDDHIPTTMQVLGKSALDAPTWFTSDKIIEDAGLIVPEYGCISSYAENFSGAASGVRITFDTEEVEQNLTCTTGASAGITVDSDGDFRLTFTGSARTQGSSSVNATVTVSIRKNSAALVGSGTYASSACHYEHDGSNHKPGALAVNIIVHLSDGDVVYVDASQGGTSDAFTIVDPILTVERVG